MAVMHGPAIPPNSTKFLTFNDLDSRFRGNNLRNNTLYAVNSDGHSQYLDDVSEFAKLVAIGVITVFTATQVVSSGTFTQGASAAFSELGDGTVSFG